MFFYSIATMKKEFQWSYVLLFHCYFSTFSFQQPYMHESLI